MLMEPILKAASITTSQHDWQSLPRSVSRMCRFSSRVKIRKSQFDFDCFIELKCLVSDTFQALIHSCEISAMPEKYGENRAGRIPAIPAQKELVPFYRIVYKVVQGLDEESTLKRWLEILENHSSGNLCAPISGLGAFSKPHCFGNAI